MKTPFSAYQGDEPYVFVCYAHEDSGIVYPELAWLHERGINVWYDEGISPGEEWSEELGQAINHAELLLFFVTPAAVASRHCRNEVHYAQNHERRILRVHLSETELPSGIELALGSSQAILAYDLSKAAFRSKLSEVLARHIRTSPSTSAETLPTRANSKYLWVAGVFSGIVVLIGLVGWLARSDWAEQGAVTSTMDTSQLAIAVRSFANRSGDPDQDYFSQGIAIDIHNELARNTELEVRPTSSSFALKGDLDIVTIGDRLKVTHVIDGSVQKSGNLVRVTAELSDTTRNTSIWSNRYDGDVTQIFEIQDDITREVVSALNTHFKDANSRRQRVDIEAYEAFLLGRQYFTEGEIEKASEWAIVAVNQDPGFADAWALRGNVAVMQGVADPNESQYRDVAAGYFDKVLEIDPQHPVALANRAFQEFLSQDYQKGLSELVRLAKLYPNNETILRYLALCLHTLGWWDLAHQVNSRLLDLSPLAQFALNQRITTVLLSGDLSDGRLALEEYKRSGGTNLYYSVMVAIAEGDVSALQEISTLADPLISGFASYWASCLNGTSTPLPEGEYVHWFLWQVALCEGDLDGAFGHYRTALRVRENAAINEVRGTLGYRYAFPEFYSDPRFQEMLEEFGLDSISVSKIPMPELPF